MTNALRDSVRNLPPAGRVAGPHLQQVPASRKVGRRRSYPIEVYPMVHCTDLIRALEQYCRGYGDQANIDRLLAMARRNQEDPRVFAWQRERLATLVSEVEASRDHEHLPAPRLTPAPTARTSI